LASATWRHLGGRRERAFNAGPGTAGATQPPAVRPIACAGMTTDHAHPFGAALAAVQRRLPGMPRRREDVLRECQEATSERRARIDACLWPFWAPDPDVFYRWRI
jgi:hypothetical protein